MSLTCTVCDGTALWRVHRALLRRIRSKPALNRISLHSLESHEAAQSLLLSDSVRVRHCEGGEPGLRLPPEIKETAVHSRIGCTTYLLGEILH